MHYSPIAWIIHESNPRPTAAPVGCITFPHEEHCLFCVGFVGFPGSPAKLGWETSTFERIIIGLLILASIAWLHLSDPPRPFRLGTSLSRIEQWFPP